MKVVFITNIPAPYRSPVHGLVAKEVGNYSVIYLARSERNRNWNHDNSENVYSRIFLDSRRINRINEKTPIYYGTNIIRTLIKTNPDIVIASGFSPPIVQSFIWAKINRKKFISFSDGTLNSERNLLFLQKLIRKLIVPRSNACIGASKKTIALFESHGAERYACFQSHLCANNDHFFDTTVAKSERRFDILICGQLIDRKMPLFSLEVLKVLSRTHTNLNVAVVGAGPLKIPLTQGLQNAGIRHTCTGSIHQSSIPAYYLQSKVLLFPTKEDPWGVVANEACAAGTPVITCDEAGAANELIQHGENGYVLPLSVEQWADHVSTLLKNDKLWNEFSLNCRDLVEPYNYKNASNGIIAAINYVNKIEK